jgi:hypothetical protein
MQGFRTYALAVCLSTVLVLGTAATTPTTRAAHSLDGSIITQILTFFGIELQSRILTPPG